MSLRPQQHLYPIIDIMIKKTIDEVREDGGKISCHKGCDHCCHLLVEVSWTEAKEMAYWLLQQPEAERAAFLASIDQNAADAKELFLQSKKDKQYIGRVFDDDAEISEKTHDRYFYDKRRPCPFLAKEGHCLAYEVRPSACRMHVVTSPAELCSADVGETSEYCVPDEIDDMRDEDIAPLNEAVNGDEGWGHMSIMVNFALEAIRQAEKVSV